MSQGKPAALYKVALVSKGMICHVVSSHAGLSRLVPGKIKISIHNSLPRGALANTTSCIAMILSCIHPFVSSNKA